MGRVRLTGSRFANTAFFIPGVVLSLGILAFIALFYSYHFSFKEQTHLFLYNSWFFHDFFSKPAVLSRYLGDFFIQFFYLRGGAALVISILFFLLFIGNSLLIKKLHTNIFNKGLYGMMATIPAFVLLLNFEYNIASLLSILLITWGLVLYLGLPSGKYRPLLALCFVPVGYVLLGVDVLFFGVLTFLIELKGWVLKSKKSLVIAFIPFVLALIIPLIFREYYGLSLKQAYLWPLQNENSDWIFWKNLPYLVFVLLLPVPFVLKFYKTSYQKAILIGVSGLLIFIGGYVHVDFKVERILALDSEWYYGNTDRIQNLSQKYPYRSSVAAYYQNLANSAKGELAENFFDIQQTGINGLFLPVSNTETYLSILFSNEVYYHIGDVNGAQHSALLGMIFSPGNYSSRLLRRLIQINIINGEYLLAEKYLRILSETLFHRKWAQNLLGVLHDESLISRVSWVRKKRALVPSSEQIRRPNDHHMTLELLLQENPQNETALNYKLCYHLMNKELEEFAQTFFTHHNLLLRRKIPQLYQEALVVYHLNNPDLTIWSKIPVENETIRGFMQYTKLYEESEGHGKTLQEEFEDTYWFYYHYAVIKK